MHNNRLRELYVKASNHFAAVVAPSSEPALQALAHRAYPEWCSAPTADALRLSMRRLSLLKQLDGLGRGSAAADVALSIVENVRFLGWLDSAETIPPVSGPIAQFRAACLQPGSAGEEAWAGLDRLVSDWSSLEVHRIPAAVPCAAVVHGIRFMTFCRGENWDNSRPLRTLLAAALDRVGLRWAPGPDHAPDRWRRFAFPQPEYDMLQVLDLASICGAPLEVGRSLEALGELVSIHEYHGRIPQSRFESGHSHEDAWLELRFLMLLRRILGEGDFNELAVG